MRTRVARNLSIVVAGMLISTACVTGGAATCERITDPARSVARVWNEALLDAIRRDFPAPTVHSRNLFHVSAAMWDAWAAYDPVAAGYFVDESHDSENTAADREEAMSYAAYRILHHRYARSGGAGESLGSFDEIMAQLCFPADDTAVDGDSPAALGNRIAAAVIAHGQSDGANERGAYAGEYIIQNPPLEIDEPGSNMIAPDRWQPLSFDEATSQNGIPIPAGIQEYVGPHWGSVVAFALAPAANGLPIDPGDPPRLADPETRDEFMDAVVEVVRASSTLDPTGSPLIDIGPAALGNSTLGTNDGTGYDVNPATGEPYAPNEVLQADFGRVIAEFWADGPQSETPPGHWNTLANAITDDPALERRIGGEGPVVDQLEWDVKLYFVLNGALHDGAVAAWGAKAYYDYVRPISMVRYLGGLGQSTDPALASYDVNGLPLTPGLIELITPESVTAGRHGPLADHVGEIALYAWTGPPGDAESSVGGVAWIRAVEWLPYQLDTFVTPAFPGYVSGHSTFSRAAAEVLTAFTGDPFFPGGLGEWTIPANGLDFEAGPTADVTLQWATYRDAADQAGLSRIYGGIHVRADDLAGRLIGADCGRGAWDLAATYWAGSGETLGS